MFSSSNPIDVSLKRRDDGTIAVDNVKIGITQQVYEDVKSSLSVPAEVVRRNVNREEMASHIESSKSQEREERRALHAAAKRLHDDTDSSEDEPPKKKISQSTEKDSSSWLSQIFNSDTQRLKQLEEEATRARERQRKLEDDALALQNRLAREQKIIGQRVADAEAAVHHERSTKTGWLKWW